MQSTSRGLAGTVPAMESEAGLTTTTPLSHSVERPWQYKFEQSNLAVGDKRPAATYGEPSSPTQSRRKRLRPTERRRSVGVTSPSSSYHDTTRGLDHNGDYEVDENEQLCLPKTQSQKPLSNHSMDGNDESIDNSTLYSTVTPQSSTANREEKSRDSSVKMQSTVQSRHFGKPSSGNTNDPQPSSDHHDTGVPVVNSYALRTPQRPMMPGVGRNSSSSSSSSRGHRSPASGSSSKRSGKSLSSEAGPKPLGMICWHKANGVGCPGYRSAGPRRLLSDHSMTPKNNFNHILSSPCQRCKRIFDSEEALDAHSSENVSCTPWPKGQRQPANEEICQTGATPDRMNQIKNALFNYNKCILHSECMGREEELENWVASNVNEYVGESQTTSDDAKLELGKWFIGWYMFFPRSQIPKSPFVATEIKKSRGWQLLEPDLLASGLRPAELLKLRRRYEDVTDIVDLEEARQEHEARRMKGQNPGTSTNQSSTPVSNSTVSQPNSSPPSQSASVASSNNSRSSNTSVGSVQEDPFSDRAQAPSLHEASNSPTEEISSPPIRAAPQPTSASPTQARSTAFNPQNWSDRISTPEFQAVFNEIDEYFNFDNNLDENPCSLADVNNDG